MKKIIFILILFLSCFLIYINTNNKKIYYLNIGDRISFDNKDNVYGYSYHIKNYLSSKKKLAGYNDYFTNEDYRITDLISLIKENKMTDSKKSPNTINQLLKKSNLLTISIGTNELYYKLSYKNGDIYTYIDEMMLEYEELLKLIAQYQPKKIYILGFYNVTNKSQDIFAYANYKLYYLAKKYEMEFINLQKILKRNTAYLDFSNNYGLNNEEYRKISQIIIDQL